MNYKYIVLLIIIALLLASSLFTLQKIRSLPECRAVNASVTVKTLPSGRAMLGFNTDKDMLKFGVVSPGVLARRTMTAEYAFPGIVSVVMEGDVKPWVTITPSRFTAIPGEKNDVAFELSVPPYAADGNYGGKALFCVSMMKNRSRVEHDNDGEKD